MTRRHAVASPRTFLYGSSAPTKPTRWASGTGLNGGPENDSRSLYVGKHAVAGTPRVCSTSDDVKLDSARVASARLSERMPIASATGESTFRAAEPYSRVNVR